MLGVGTSAWPLGNDVFLGFVVGGKGECDARKGGALVMVRCMRLAGAWQRRLEKTSEARREEDRAYEINADNELGLALARALDLGAVLAKLLGRRTTGLRRRTGRIPGGRTVALGAARRAAGTARMAHGRTAAHAGGHVGRVAEGRACVDGRRAAGHLRGRGVAVGALAGERAGAADGRLTALLSWGAGRVVCGIAGRAVASPGVVHWKRRGRGRGRAGEGSEGGGAGGRQLRRLRLERRRRGLRYLAGRRGAGGAGGDAVDGLDAGGGFALSEPEVFQARVDRAHKEGAGRGEEGEKEKRKRRRRKRTKGRCGCAGGEAGKAKKNDMSWAGLG